ncbi:MAG: Uma2 family endonuclease [Tychonema bourrellyi B0820]|uniref:Uma2 family endonuclease n=1 Tax=Tychonema bourrellyi FEM_GT703 TaxID=2040638 RepID=A0A2G4F647_9CYAN|nr:Uma2 family endonuclease [Tychonema bourrellyi]MDQ2098160.1 Uma2 family endonuclease [Tychonema bourrellyi B0820]PHX57195.1 Uma2 family endonuclease [Tychonema bourrellyi FEM_GT703]
MVIASTKPPTLTDPTKARFTLDEYRAIEETAEERHEYCNGEIIAMSGGSPAHSRITVDVTTFLNVALRDTNFQTYNGDLRIWIPGFNHGTYPDITVIDGEPEFNADRTDEILNPLLIVEVLSPSTEAYDRTEKFRKYRSIPSFCEYLLVSQTEPYIEQYYNCDRPNSDRWQWQVYDGLDRAIVLHSLNIELPMSEVYRRINFSG